MGLAVTVIGYAVAGRGPFWGGFALAVVLWTLGELGTFLSPPLRLPPWHSASARGTYQGVYNVVWSASIKAAPLIGGWTISNWRSNAVDRLHCCVDCRDPGLKLTKGSRDRAVARSLHDSL